MFMGPLEAVKPWQTSQIQGVVRFRDRLDAVCRQPLVDAMDDATRRLLHRTIKKVSTDIDAMAFNTAISVLMVFVNHLARLSAMPREAVRALVLLVSPFAPHVAEELWRHLGHAASLAYEPWPAWDEALAVDDVIELPVQVNGKVRGRVQLARDASEADARAAALAARGIEARGRAGGAEVRLRAGAGRESRGRLKTLAQYRPPSLRWSQLTTFSGMILSTTRFGALACAPGWIGDGLACAAARPSNASLTLASSSRISQRPRIITPRSSAYSSPASISSATLGLRRMLTTFCAFPYEVM
jgi:hypothetical protein